MAREVAALMGERAPPISMIPVQPKYKQRPRRQFKPAPWVLEPFTNGARHDELVLQHWARKQAPKLKPTESAASDAATQPEQPSQEEYKYAKYNITIDAPEYTDDLYDAQLQDPDWSREETDYLVQLVKDYGQKWPVVVDRYHFPENADESNTKERTMEHLKHRYYTVRAKVLAHNIPISSMNAQEYALYSTLQSYNPTAEIARKKLAESHLQRSPLEVDEEIVLLAELQRIMINQTALDNERKEIRDRLEFPISTNNQSAAQYSSSQSLATLFQSLLQADRLKKDRKFKNVPENYPNNPASSATATSAAPGTAQPAHRDSISTANQPRKASVRDSIGGASTDGRPLTAHAEQRFFVTHHDRLNGGVTFASDKLHKPRIAKSTIQTERIAAVLSHLQIPDIIPLPTQKIVEEFDRLMQKVHVLLEMRKVAEKEEQEIRVKSAEGSIKAEKEREKSGTAVKEERKASVVPSDGTAGQGQKRSASVMSEGAGGQQGSSKRPKT